MRRPLLIGLVVVGLLAFAAVSAGLARVLSADGAERSAAIEVVKAQVSGDTASVVRRIEGCREDPRCVAGVEANVRRLRRPGEKLDLLNVSSPGFTLAARTGRTRIAWKTGVALPVVQCVTTSRRGSVLDGYEVAVLRLSAPIDSEASC